MNQQRLEIEVRGPCAMGRHGRYRLRPLAIRLAASIAVPVLMMASSAAMAQGQQPAQPTSATNVDARLRLQLPPPSESERVEETMTGDTDIVLLRRPPLFTIQGGLTVSPTSNAFLTPDGAEKDVIMQVDSSLRIGTRIADRVDMFAEGGLVMARYMDNPTLDYSAAVGTIGVATRIAMVQVVLTYQPSLVYTRDFTARQLTQHRLGAALSLPTAFAGFAVEPRVSVERALSSPSAYRNWAYTADLTVSRSLAPAILAYATAGYEHRRYDDYFTDFLGVERRDDLARASVGVVWRPREWGDVRVAYNFAKNHSTSDVNGYVAHSGALALSAQVRF